jgi:hypothetical protein
LGIYDATVAGYVADVLADFARADNLYKFRNRAGCKVDSVVEMLARPVDAGEEKDVLRERSLRKYTGDYALFMSGIFRKYVEGSGTLEYYIREGSRSYWTVSELDLSLYRAGYTIPGPSITHEKPISPRRRGKTRLPGLCARSKVG